jgi:hypothetical protein
MLFPEERKIKAVHVRRGVRSSYEHAFPIWWPLLPAWADVGFLYPRSCKTPQRVSGFGLAAPWIGALRQGDRMGVREATAAAGPLC